MPLNGESYEQFLGQPLGQEIVDNNVRVWICILVPNSQTPTIFMGQLHAELQTILLNNWQRHDLIPVGRILITDLLVVYYSLTA
jgi:hypothetical protein